MDKTAANEVLGVAEKLADGNCTRDRALEEIARLMEKYAETQPIVGYVTTGSIKKVFRELVETEEDNPEGKPYTKKFSLHINSLDLIKRMLKQ